MKGFKQIAFFLLSISLLISCTSTRKIQKNLNANSYSMAYLMDSEISNFKKDIGVSIDSINYNAGILNDSTKVTREKGWFIPLLFAYIWHSENNCIQGESMFEEDLPYFLRQSIIKEINRSGGFYYFDTLETDYTLKLEINDIGTKGPYISKGYAYSLGFYDVYSFSDVAGPAFSHLDITYELILNNHVVKSNTFSVNRFTEQINKSYRTRALLQRDYAISMVEATSSNFKEIIKLIVDDLNTYFKEK